MGSKRVSRIRDSSPRRRHRRSLESSLFPAPALPAGRVRQRLFQCRSQLVDGIIKSEVFINSGVQARGLCQIAKQLTMVCARKFHVVRVIVGKLTSGEVLRMVPPASVWAHGVTPSTGSPIPSAPPTAPAILQAPVASIFCGAHRQSEKLPVHKHPRAASNKGSIQPGTPRSCFSDPLWFH